ncbi:hypothetical protein AAMO2058_001304700 [Amorphochlora amoebiformis]
MALEVKFTHYSKVRSNTYRPFVSYEMTVQSPSTNSWVIEKRYSEFHKLHTNLRKLAADDMWLPALPGRRVFGSNMDEDFVRMRQSQLQKYMRELLRIPDILKGETEIAKTIMDFLLCPESVRPLLTGEAQKDGNQWLSVVPNNTKSYPDKSPEDRRVYQLIDQLRQGNQRGAAIQSFEEYFFTMLNQRNARFHLPRKTIHYLLVGSEKPMRRTSQSGIQTGGLVETSGNIKYSKVASRAALDLICRLTDCERNRHAFNYIEILKSLGVSTLRQLNLATHIIHQRGSRLGALRLLSILQYELGEIAVAQILNDTTALASYKQWALQESGRTVSLSSDEGPQNSFGVANLADIPVKIVIREALKGVQTLAKITIETNQDSKDSKSDGPSIWKQATLPAEIQREDIDVGNRLEYTCDGMVTTVRVQAVVDFSVENVTNLLLDVNRTGEWNVKFHKAKVIQRINDRTDLIHEVYKSFSSPYKYRDFALIRTWNELPGGGSVIAYRSVIHPRCPEQKGLRRAVLLPSGYVVQPLGNRKGSADSKESIPQCSEVTFVAQFTRESVLVVTPDLLGETSELIDSLKNINTVLTKIHGETTKPKKNSKPKAEKK